MNFIKRQIRKIKFLYFFWCKINYFIEKRNFNVFFYNTEYDIEINKGIYKKYGLNFEPTLDNSFQETIPLKFKLFKSLKQKMGDKSLKILEIGTLDGEFTNYLSKLFSNSEIFTIDLPENDIKFINSYDRAKNFEKFLEKRSNNIKNSNINFIEMDSLNILSKFNENFFDIIFVDGDHRDPVVSKDIFNSYKLLKKDGFLIIDDIYFTFSYREKIERATKPIGELPSVDAYKALEKLSSENKLRPDYMVKFYGPKNFFYNPRLGILKK